MIKSFKCKNTEKLFNDKSTRQFRSIERVARRKLEMLEAAVRLEDLRKPPANRLEPLKGNRAGQHSIRINDQFRICFVWRGNSAPEVEIVDYH
ncbi:MAG: type II toxin-antitoxin system RelE/ParE family toxin [Bdellovibrionales bacterium]|nr:type II toxin-antitoxin system RelE/ParE family toxin [Bdellovibrionales bacterium]